MNIFKAVSPNNPRFQEIEFAFLLGWALLFPDKQSHLYSLGFFVLLAAFTMAKVFTFKNIALDRFSAWLFLLNAVFIYSAFFSRHPYRSLLFVGDVFLLSLWCIFFYLEKRDMDRYLRLAAIIISLSSLGMIIFFVLQGGRGPVTPFFKNPILQGIASALAALVFLHALLRKYGHADLLLLALNSGAVVVSASKAAFLGMVLFAAAMLVRHRRRWLVYLVAVLLLILLVPNPVRRMAQHSLRHDPYALNRLDIWSMSARMFRSNFWTGVGPDLFAEAAKRFNFPQENGPARYFKLPESAHSDYWKIIAENGIPGLVFVLLFLFFAIRRLLSPPGLDLPRWLLTFLLAQMLLFNFIFNYFFLILFFFLLHDFFASGQRFVSLRPASRAFFSSLLVFSLFVLYLSPFVADRLLDAAANEPDPIRRFPLFMRAGLFSPLDERVPLAEAAVLRAFAGSRSSLEAWGDAVANLRRAQELNGNSIAALVQESGAFRDLLAKRVKYPALGEEILAPLLRAEKLDPFNPFLKMQQAVVLREFGRSAEARRMARAALSLEPEYVAAILFLHELDGLPAGDPALWERISRIREKARGLRARPGSYLFKLHQLPKGAAGR